nr:hypothetical protein [Pedobacter sp. ASV19]
MKTDFVEIFQTIRAAMQPYATLGFANRENSDRTFDLWSDKNVKSGPDQRSETFFASISANEHEAILKTNFGHEVLKGSSVLKIKELDEELMNQIEDALAVGYKLFKEKEWV